MAGIRIKNGPSQGQTFTIREEPLVVGRDDACGMPLQDKGASRRHAEIFSIGEMCFIRDLDSRNGSFVNDSKITEEMLRDGDRIQIGGTIMIFEDQGGDPASSDLEFSEEEIGDFYELRLEDLTSANVGEGDASSEQHLRALYRFSRLVSSDDSEDGLIRKALTSIAESFHADGSYLFGRDPEKGGVMTLGSHVPKGRSGQLSKTIIRKVLQDRRALLVTDAMRDDRFSSNESVMKHNIHAVICAPLALTGDLQAVLYIAGDDPAVSFTEQELELAAAMADQIGLALSHAASRKASREFMRSALRLMLEVADGPHPGASAQNMQIASYMVAIGKALKLKPADLENLQMAGLLYNFADLASPLRNAAAPENTARRLSGEPFFAEIVDTIKFQREKYDGSGPAGMAADDIPLGARIFQAARDLESVCNPARGDDLLDLDDAVQDIVDKSGRAYDPSVTSALSQANKAGLLALTLDEQWATMGANAGGS